MNYFKGPKLNLRIKQLNFILSNIKNELLNKFVNAFYEASEYFNDDLEYLALAFIQVREKKDKRRPKNIKELTQECNFKLLHPYAKKICDMNYKEIELLKEKINTKAIKTKGKLLND